MIGVHASAHATNGMVHVSPCSCSHHVRPAPRSARLSTHQQIAAIQNGRFVNGRTKIRNCGGFKFVNVAPFASVGSPAWPMYGSVDAALRKKMPKSPPCSCGTAFGSQAH